MSEERNKVDGEVVRILKKLGITAENLTALRESHNPAQKSLAAREKNKERMWVFIGLAVGALGIWYTIVTPEPDFRLTSAFLAMAIFFGALAAMEWLQTGKRGKVFVILTAILVFVGADWVSYQAKTARESKKWLETLAQENRDTYRDLHASLEYSEGDDPMRSEFVYSNEGNLPIIVSRICAKLRGFGAADFNFMTGSELCMYKPGEVHRIREGGDGQSKPFLSTLLNGFKFTCADLTILVAYRIESHSFGDNKQFRFVSRWYPHGMRWLKEDVESSDDFCQDEAFQAPYGNTTTSGKPAWGKPPTVAFTPDYTVTLPATGIGGSWRCGTTAYGPYVAHDQQKGLQQAINDVEACRTKNNAAMLLLVPPGVYSGPGIVIPQTSNTPATKWIVVRSTEHDKIGKPH